jgi:hypothetical protein
MTTRNKVRQGRVNWRPEKGRKLWLRTSFATYSDRKKSVTVPMRCKRHHSSPQSQAIHHISRVMPAEPKEQEPCSKK